MAHASGVTKEFLHKFKAGDLVDVKIEQGHWSGPHKLIKYEIDPRMEIKLGEKKLERWLIVGVDQQMIRKHIPGEAKGANQG